MKGIVFTEFLEMVEDRFGIEMAEQIIDDADLPESHGIYTAVGTYPHAEMVALVVQLSQHAGIEVPDLLKVYGEHLFSRFYELYPNFFAENNDAMSFLASVHDTIHVEVKKLYPDAQLPRFECERISPDVLKMHYLSSRQMEDFAEGLIRGCLKHFNETMRIEREPQPDGTTVFTLFKN